MSHEKAIEKAIKMAGLDGVSHIESRLAVAIKAYLDASGMVMVPREPSYGMLFAGWDRDTGQTVLADNFYRSVWSDMISAAPNPFQTPEESREKK